VWRWSDRRAVLGRVTSRLVDADATPSSQGRVVGFFDGDGAVFADLVHGLGDDVGEGRTQEKKEF
jgi:hypothetical protein